MTIAANLLYIIAFVLFIYGLSGLTGPSTAVRGNKIAAVGMVIAFVGTAVTLRRAEAEDVVTQAP